MDAVGRTVVDLYREEILEHWRNPQNFGQIEKADLVIDQINPLCGDEVRFFFRFEKKGNPKSTFREKIRSKRAIQNPKIEEISFTGNGCAISIASASILTAFVKGKKVSVLSKITGNDVLDLIGGPVAPARLKCAFLSLEALRVAQGKLGRYKLLK